MVLLDYTELLKFATDVASMFWGWRASPYRLQVPNIKIQWENDKIRLYPKYRFFTNYVWEEKLSRNFLNIDSNCSFK